MADVVRERTSASRKAEIGGVVINTCGWVRGEGYNQIKHIAQVSYNKYIYSSMNQWSKKCTGKKPYQCFKFKFTGV